MSSRRPVVPRIGAGASTTRPQSSETRPASGKQYLGELDLDSVKKGNINGLEKTPALELAEVRSRIASAWTGYTQKIVSERNPELLREMYRLESVIDSLMVIPNWPAALNKQWRSALADYENTAMLCVKYARRHHELRLQVEGK